MPSDQVRKQRVRKAHADALAARGLLLPTKGTSIGGQPSPFAIAPTQWQSPVQRKTSRTSNLPVRRRVVFL